VTAVPWILSAKVLWPTDVPIKGGYTAISRTKSEPDELMAP
jgi:hypothetical protein